MEERQPQFGHDRGVLKPANGIRPIKNEMYAEQLLQQNLKNMRHEKPELENILPRLDFRGRHNYETNSNVQRHGQLEPLPRTRTLNHNYSQHKIPKAYIDLVSFMLILRTFD